MENKKENKQENDMETTIRGLGQSVVTVQGLGLRVWGVGFSV